jgi:hypothetical protein
LDQFGFCPYGDKCQFIHRDDDNMYTTPNVEQQQLQVLFNVSVDIHLFSVNQLHVILQTMNIGRQHVSTVGHHR